MGLGCAICSESLEELPGESQVRGGSGSSAKELNISATPCGHIFHTYCIQKWLSGDLNSSNKCPNCRKVVPHLSCLSLFPTTYEETVLNENVESPSEGPTCNHKEIISSLKSQVERLELQVIEKEEKYKDLNSEYRTLRVNHIQEKLSLERDRDNWKKLAEENESYKDLVDELQERTKRAEFQLATYSHLDNLIKGVDAKMKDDLMVNAPLTMDTVRNLLEFKHVLAAELKNKEKGCAELKEKYERIAKENLRLKGSYDKKVSELNKLKLEIERVRSTSPAPGTSREVFGSTTPKAFRIKNRFQEPLSNMTQMDTGQDVDVDEDVDIFPSSFKPTSKKKMKPTTKASSSTVPSDNDDNDDDNSNELRIRGNVPGAPLPISGTRLKSLENKSEKRSLGAIQDYWKQEKPNVAVDPTLVPKKRIFKPDTRPEKNPFKLYKANN